MECVDTTDTLWYRILALVTTGLIIGYSIANIVYYNRLRSSVSSAVSRGEATSMFVFSIIILLLATIIFIITLVRIFLGSKERSHLIGKATALANTTGGVVTFAPAGSTTVVGPRGASVIAPAPLAMNALQPTSGALLRNAQLAASR